MAFHVGQKVVCVIGHTNKGARWPAQIVVGGIYTVREIDTRCVSRWKQLGLRLEEYCEPAKMTSVGMWETPFPADHFRPVVERKTDISIFQKMLTPDHETV